MRASTCLIPLAMAAILASGASAAYAQQSTQTAPNAQQQLMKSCNTQASSKNLSGDARKTFMSDCLSGKTSSGTSTQNSQQMLMQSCNTTANSRNLTGDARKSFMSSCLKGQ